MHHSFISGVVHKAPALAATGAAIGSPQVTGTVPVAEARVVPAHTHHRTHEGKRP